MACKGVMPFAGAKRRTMEHVMIHMLRCSALLAAVVMSGCAKPDLPSVPALPPSGTTPISWDVVGVGVPGAGSRSLVGPEFDEDGNPYVDPGWVTIEHACTPTANGGDGEAIGIWADYTYTDADGQQATMKNIFQDTRLIYAYKTDGNPYSLWNYEGSDLYWSIGGVYKFRAYFPQRLADNVVSSTNATTFVIEYPTHYVQEDLLLAYNSVDTSNPQTNLNDPVPLQFSHGLAALRFFVKAKYDNEDELTSCYLQNADTRDFATSGMLAYGSETDVESISWIMGYNPPVTERIYYWRNSGVRFSTDSAGNSTAAMAYSQAGTAEGDLFTQNDGWVLIPPQKSSGALQFCFTTSNGEDAVYKVTIPKVTERRDNGDGTFTESEEYLPGKRYTYTIAITETKLELTLSVADWNERESSFGIVF